uniref:ZPT2-12 n=1 Tax=Petunia hybrida TaxID=4102 RepID=O22084_PETHY|nr:ZPT2-12 [Petunia x hybrida]
MSAMKRSREDRQVEAAAMANCLMLLSKLNDKSTSTTTTNQDHHNDFECKTCNKRFSSFQALGGHRASHKRPKLLIGAGEFLVQPSSKKMHECSICGMEFSLGQALGGHMRRHRAAIDEKSKAATKAMMIPVLKKSNSSKRIFCLDLNLTPRNEDVDLKLWPTAPISSPVLRIFI